MFDHLIKWLLISLLVFTPIALGSVEIWAFSLMELGILLLIALYIIQNLLTHRRSSGLAHPRVNATMPPRIESRVPRFSAPLPLTRCPSPPAPFLIPFCHKGGVFQMDYSNRILHPPSPLEGFGRQISGDEPPVGGHPAGGGRRVPLRDAGILQRAPPYSLPGRGGPHVLRYRNFHQPQLPGWLSSYGYSFIDWIPSCPWGRSGDWVQRLAQPALFPRWKIPPDRLWTYCNNPWAPLHRFPNGDLEPSPFVHFDQHPIPGLADGEKSFRYLGPYFRPRLYLGGLDRPGCGHQEVLSHLRGLQHEVENL